MTSHSTPKLYEFRSRFRAPLAFVFRWCTDYTPDDPRLEGDDYVRRILRKGRRRVVYQDLEDLSDGWRWSHVVVDLHPPLGWHAEITGSHRDWSIDYELSRLPHGITELHFRGKRRTTPLGGKNPAKGQLEGELRGMWRRFGRALEADYRATQKVPRSPRK